MRFARYSRFGADYGPAAPPSSGTTAALQQRMMVLGYTGSPPGIYGEAEQVVVDSYADQLGIEDRSNLETVIQQILPVMDEDIAVAGMVGPKGPKGPVTGDPLNLTGQPPVPDNVNWGALIALGLVLYVMSKS